MTLTLIAFWPSATATRSTSPAVTSIYRSAKGAQGSTGTQVLPVLQHIVFGGYVALALWTAEHDVGEFGLDIRTAALLAACSRRRAAAYCARLAAGCRTNGRAQRDLVGDAGELDRSFSPQLSADRSDHRHGERPADPAHRPQRLRLYAHVRPGIAFAFGKASVFKQISSPLSEQHRHHQRRCRPGRRLGGFAADHVARCSISPASVRAPSCSCTGVVWVSLIWMYLTELAEATSWVMNVVPLKSSNRY